MKETEYKVVEIFDSIDGEGIFAGQLATFIRLAGCNLRCSYCDTRYAFDAKEAVRMTADEIVRKAHEIGNENITLTGGEPLIQAGVKELVNRLCAEGFTVNIETNGAVDVRDFQSWKTVITMDYKTVSSGENAKMSIERINTLRFCDVLKIVCEESDFDDIEKLMEKITTLAWIYISPVYGRIEPCKLVEFQKKLRDKGYKGIRVQLQLHKIIWNPDKRGV